MIGWVHGAGRPALSSAEFIKPTGDTGTGLVVGRPAGSGVRETGAASDFGTMLRDAIESGINGAAELQNEADRLTLSALAGENVEIHDVVLETEKSKLALELIIQIRNKAVESYQEIMRMQI